MIYDVCCMIYDIYDMKYEVQRMIYPLSAETLEPFSRFNEHYYQTCSKIKCADEDFLKFHPFSNLKAQILEIWPSAPDSAKKNRAAMES